MKWIELKKLITSSSKLKKFDIGMCPNVPKNKIGVFENLKTTPQSVFQIVKEPRPDMPE